jgi:hypothetical protein
LRGRRLGGEWALGQETIAVITGLVPVSQPNANAFGDVVKPPEKLWIGRNRRRVDGRDKPRHDGKGGLNGIA